MVDTFPENDIHFLDLRITEDGIDIYCQYTLLTQNSVDKCLIFCAMKICTSSEALKKQVHQIKMFLPWNGFPSKIKSKLLLSNTKTSGSPYNNYLTLAQKGNHLLKVSGRNSPAPCHWNKFHCCLWNQENDIFSFFFFQIKMKYQTAQNSHPAPTLLVDTKQSIQYLQKHFFNSNFWIPKYNVEINHIVWFEKSL